VVTASRGGSTAGEQSIERCRIERTDDFERIALKEREIG
jgi:hypothetical protein